MNLIFAARPRRLFAAPTGLSSHCKAENVWYLGRLDAYGSIHFFSLVFTLKIYHFRGFELKLKLVRNQGDEFRVCWLDTAAAKSYTKQNRTPKAYRQSIFRSSGGVGVLFLICETKERQPKGSATREKHPNTTNELPFMDSIPVATFCVNQKLATSLDLSCSWSLSAISAINSEFVGLPFVLLTV